jgi:hypothetical protein
MPDAEIRIPSLCPRCGRPSEGRFFCEGCGLNLRKHAAHRAPARPAPLASRPRAQPVTPTTTLAQPSVLPEPASRPPAHGSLGVTEVHAPGRDALPTYCPNCAARATGAGAFCATCGEPLSGAPTRPMRSVAPPQSRPPAVAPPAGARPVTRSGRGVLAIFGVGLLLIGVALYIGGVFSRFSAPSGSGPAASTPASSTMHRATSGTTPSYTVPASEQPATTFVGRVFTIHYPAGWQVNASEQPKSWGTDTTIASPSEPNTYLRVDVSPNANASNARSAAQPVISQLERAPGYQQVDLSRETPNGAEALHWEFRVEQSGTTLHKEDVFFIAPNGDSVAVLTQAPDSLYEGLRSQFAALRKSLSMRSA